MTALAQSMVESADLIFMPYNYLVDASTRRGLESIRWADSVLIFDEAHNVEASP